MPEDNGKTIKDDKSLKEQMKDIEKEIDGFEKTVGASRVLEDNTLKELDALNKALKAGSRNPSAKDISGSALIITELSELSEKHLSAQASVDLTKRSLQVTIKDGKDWWTCVYFSVKTKVGNEEKGVEAISKAINELSEARLIHSCLCPISSISLALEVFKNQTSAVFCFVLVPGDKIKEIENRYKGLAVESGELGNEVESLDIELKDGEFLAEIRLSHVSSLAKKAGLDRSDALMKKENDYQSNALEKEVNRYLSLLPKGTKVVETIPAAIQNTLLPYTVKFYHPAMEKVKRMSLDWVRVCGRENEEGRLTQYSLTSDINYYDENGENLYKPITGKEIREKR